MTWPNQRCGILVSKSILQGMTADDATLDDSKSALQNLQRGSACRPMDIEMQFGF